ncbi:MAG: NYN domain-containing protein [Acidimicrobiia bacterium]|nr:NYN domain-containing protein [Acidimicrobiia bacterium]
MGNLQRIAVFIDYQNSYMGAREAFGFTDSPSHVDGQFHPLALARLIAARHPSYSGAQLRRLAHVAIYRGLPSSERDPKGYGATRKQIAAWRRNFTAVSPGSVTSHIGCRPFSYQGGRAREKGIDVQIALDLAFGAHSGNFDVIVLFSADSDLLPALERASSFGVDCEIAGWAGRGPRQSRASYVRWEHRLQRLDYEQVHDPADYRPPIR